MLELPAVDICPDHAGDQVAGDHKEDVHADKPAAKAGKAEMEQQNGEHRGRAETVDICSVVPNRI